jgi:hypothetical protein
MGLTYGMPNLTSSLQLPNIRDKAGAFTPEHPRLPGAGRPPGRTNKITRDLKVGIMEAAIAYGADGFGAGGLTGYLYHLAADHPKAFASLLAKMLPYQVSSNSSSSAIGTINVVSIPAGQFLDAADISKFQPALVVEAALEDALDEDVLVEDDQRDDQEVPSEAPAAS